MEANTMLARLTAEFAALPKEELESGAPLIVELDGQPHRITEAGTGRSAAIALTSGSLERLLEGKTTPQEAFLNGEIKLSGDSGAGLLFSRVIAHIALQ